MVRATTSVSAWRVTSVNKMRWLAQGFALLLLAAAVHGAEPGAAEEEGEAAASTAEESGAGSRSEEEGAASTDVDSAVDAEIRAAEEAAAAAPPGNTDEAFVPSVQISEDLSVSFPVDI